MDDDALSIRQFGPQPRRRIGLNFKNAAAWRRASRAQFDGGRAAGRGVGGACGIVLDRKTPRPVGTTGAVFPFAPACRNIPVSAPPRHSGALGLDTRSNREDTQMGLRINDTAPDFSADTTEGPINFHEWIGDGYAVLFSHPKDFTPVCTTELGYMAGLKDEFARRNAKMIGISVDPVENHNKWKADIEKLSGNKVDYPMIGDPTLAVAKLYDMLPAGAGETSEGRTPADNATVRSVFLIGPDKKIKLMLTYPMTTGRNFDEILRALDSIQLTAKHAVATPAQWKQGEDVIITAAVSDEDATKRFGSFDRVLPYLRRTKQPALDS
jgi:alkyl hydroperoxide reductase subunit AhpC